MEHFPESDLSSRNENHVKRRISELLEAEHCYVREVRRTLRLYHTPLTAVASTESAILPQTVIDHIFSSLPQIASYHERLFDSLTDAASPGSPAYRRAKRHIAMVPCVLALAMARHPRLGHASPANSLDADLLQHIGSMLVDDEEELPTVLSSLCAAFTRQVDNDGFFTAYATYLAHASAAIQTAEALIGRGARVLQPYPESGGLSLPFVMEMPTNRLSSFMFLWSDILRHTSSVDEYLQVDQVVTMLNERMLQMRADIHALKAARFRERLSSADLVSKRARARASFVQRIRRFVCDNCTSIVTHTHALDRGSDEECTRVATQLTTW